MPGDFFTAKIEGIPYVPQRIFCGRCGLEHTRKEVRFYWCGNIDRWCCQDCQTDEDWKRHEVDDDVSLAEKIK